MKRKTAYQIAIAALKEKQGRQYVFDYHMYLTLLKSGQNGEHLRNAYDQYLRISEAIDILESEKDHQQLPLID